MKIFKGTNFFFIYLILFIFLFLDGVSAKYDIPATLQTSGGQITLPEKSECIVKVEGDVDTTKKYLLISAGDFTQVNPSLYFFVTKNENIDPQKEEYDYSSMQKTNKGNKLVLPISYFNKDNFKGFFLKVKCIDSCSNLLINFSYENTILLNIGEKFSFYSKEYRVDDFGIKIQHSGAGKLAFIISGGNEEQISMEVNSKNATKYLSNVFAYVEDVDGSQTESNIKIKVDKNVRFNFFTQILSEESQITLYEGEYNQIFFIPENKENCFNVNYFGETGFQDEYEFLIVGQKELNFRLILGQDMIHPSNIMDGGDGQKLLLSYRYKNKETKICLDQLTTDPTTTYSLVHISLNKKNGPMPESLLLSESYMFKISDDDINKVNVHTHSQFFDKSPGLQNLYGVNVGIQILAGKIKLYKTKCTDYPFCTYNINIINQKLNEKDPNIRSLTPINAYYSNEMNAENETYSLSNIQNNVILAVCESQSCIYIISFYDNQSIKPLHDQEKIVKYLGPYIYLEKSGSPISRADKYSMKIKPGSKIILDLVVYSGDAYIDALNYLNGCTFTKFHYGSNERRIAECENANIEKVLTFPVKATKNGAVYLIYIQEKTADTLDDLWPTEMTTLESIQGPPRYLSFNEITVNIDDPSQTNKYVNIFNVINCDLEIKNLKNEKVYTTKNDDFITDIAEITMSESSISYQIKLSDFYHVDAKTCYYFISSFNLNDEKSFMTIPEAKPFTFKLSNEIPKIRAIFPYASTDPDPNIYLAVNLYNDVPIKLTITIGNKQQEYSVFQSINIPIVTGKLDGMDLNSMVKVKIIAEFKGQIDEEAVVDFNIKTDFRVPYFLKSEEQFTDVINANNTQYYVTLVSQDSSGDVSINFKSGSGDIFGRLISTSGMKERGEWKNEFYFPIPGMPGLLNYDYSEQKLTFYANDTVGCRPHCFLIFGVKSKDTYEKLSVGYNLFFRYEDMGEAYNNYVDIKNYEYVLNSIKSLRDDYYKFTSFSDAEEILIYFKSEYCKLEIVFDPQDFRDKSKIITYNRTNGRNDVYRLTKNKINKNSLKDVTLYIRVRSDIEDKSIDVNKIDMHYKFKVSAPIKLMKKVTLLDSTHPVFCDNSYRDGYCDFLLNLDTMIDNTTIEILSSSSSNDKLTMYIKFMNSEDFQNRLNNNNLPDWPTNTNHHLPKEKEEVKDYIRFFTDDHKNEKKVLIRVYSEQKRNITTYLFIHNQKYKTITPFPRELQLFSVDQEQGLNLVIPNDTTYEVHITVVEGEGSFLFNGSKNYTLDGKYSSLILITEKNGQNIIKVISSTQGDDNYFHFTLWYSVNNFGRKINKLSKNSVYNIMANNGFPLRFYEKIPRRQYDLPFNIYLNELTYSSGFKDSIKSNATEIFNVKGYLLTEKELLSFDFNKKIEGKKEYTGNYEHTLHRAGVKIPSSDISAFAKSQNSSDLFALFIVDKDTNNQRIYKSIEGKISTFGGDTEKRFVPINTYITNYFNAKEENKTHVYYLGGLSGYLSQFRNKKVEFFTLSKDVTIKFSKNPDGSNPENLNISEQVGGSENYGKEVYNIPPGLNYFYLIVENKQSEPIEYSFRYSPSLFQMINYEYNKTISYNKTSDFSSSLSLSIEKIRNGPSQEILDCNYYIRIYQMNDAKLLKYTNSSVLLDKNEKYIVYTIDKEDFLVSNKKESTINVSVNVDGFSKYYIDVVAEVLNGSDLNNELFAYKRFSPMKNAPNDVKRDKSFLNNYLAAGILIFSAVIFIVIIGLVGVSIYYKKKNSSLEKKVEEISFKISGAEEGGTNKDEENALL